MRLGKSYSTFSASRTIPQPTSALPVSLLTPTNRASTTFGTGLGDNYLSEVYPQSPFQMW